MGKIIQTAGRNALGEFAPEFAHFNDDVLFGENWNNQDIDVKTRSIITVVALMASGITAENGKCLLKFHILLSVFRLCRGGSLCFFLECCLREGCPDALIY